MKEWKEERCSSQPEQLQLIAPGLYIERRNIREVSHEADPDAGIAAYTEFICESREISVSDYQMLKSIEEINTDAAIDAYTQQLLEEGVI